MPHSRKITIAIDGYSSCGKSTLARDLANTLGYIFVDSGAMYRGITYFALKSNLFNGNSLDKQSLISNLHTIDLKFEKNLKDGQISLLLNGEDITENIRRNDVANVVSQVATIPEVRSKLVALQKEMGKNGGIVMDGRDIGTVVFPDAQLKLFVTADPKIRSKRRHDELLAKGETISLNAVTKNLNERDEMDTSRTVSPLKRADDAILFDNSLMSRETQLLKALELVEKTLAS